MEQKGKVKVIFNLDAEDWHGHGSETLWADKIAESSNGVVVRTANSSYFVKGVSVNDVVRCASVVGSTTLHFIETLEHSGHSTYVILVPVQTTNFETLWVPLRDLGCSYESGQIQTSMGNQRMYSIDVPGTSDVSAVYDVLSKGEERGVWTFQENHCGHNVGASGAPLCD